MKLGTKILLFIIGIAAFIVLIWQGYLTFRYRLHRDYRDVLADAPSKVFEVGTPFSGANDPAAPSGMVRAADSGALKLFVNPETAEAAVLDTRTGIMTYTNPPDAEEDPIARSPVNRAILKSQIIVEYYDGNRRPGDMNSYDKSTALGQFEIESLANGFRVTYTIGDMSYKYGLVPLYITEERLDYFTGRMEDRTASRVKSRYVESDEAPGFLELHESTRNLAVTIEEFTELFRDAGYTEDDLYADLSAADVDGAIPMSFIIPLEYRLENDGLLVSIPTGHIEENGGGRLERIQVLRFFGAGGADEEGYLFVPNGSGSIIYFNNGKTFAQDYQQYIYGMDPLMIDFISPGTVEPARMPYFGIQRTGETTQGVLAKIEAGDTLADITASIAGKINSYNYVYPSFTLRGSISLAMFGSTGNESTLPIVEGRFAEVDISIRYNFLTDEYAGYSGMARYARNQLIERGVLTPDNQSGDIPFYMSLVGSVAGQSRFLSIEYRGQFPMTTYAQASNITDVLANNGINNQVINYQGWFNRGYYHDVPDRIRLVSQLGSRRELENLSSKVESRGGKLFLDTSFQRVPYVSRRYNWQLETSRYYGGGMVGVLGEVCPDCYSSMGSLGYVDRIYYLVSPKFLGRYVDDFIKAFNKFNVTGLSLRDLGDDIHSDRKRTEMINREESRTIVLDSFGKLEAAAGSLMISGGNLYSFAFGTDFINVPISHNTFFIVDEEVPFYQMLLAGSANYAGMPINLSGAFDEAATVARLVEFGASPHFTFTAENSSELKYTGKNHVFAGTFNNWSEPAIRVYHAVNEVLSQVSGSFITEHEVLPDGLRRVTYDNGVVIEINGTDIIVRRAG
jgi:hypothetical protein